MKKLLLIIAVGTIIASSCKSKEQKAQEQAVSNLAEGIKEIAKNSEKIGDEVESLKKLAPLNTDALKTLLPETLAGMPRKDFSVTNNMGFAVAEARYEKDDSTNLKLTVFDCAGEAGAGFYSMNFFMRMNMQQETDRGYTKTVDFMDTKAVETFEKDNNKYGLSFLAAKRLLVTLEGRNVELDGVKGAAKSLDFSKVQQ